MGAVKASAENVPALLRIGLLNDGIAISSYDPIVHKYKKRLCRVIFDLHSDSRVGTMEVSDFRVPNSNGKAAAPTAVFLCLG